MAVKCPIERATYARNHYLKNKEAYRKRARTWTVNQSRYLKQLTDRYKIMCSCKMCGYKKCAEALELHHVNASQKENNIGNLIHNGVSTKRLKAEIRKCIVVCANCHRELHAVEKDVGYM